MESQTIFAARRSSNGGPVAADIGERRVGVDAEDAAARVGSRSGVTAFVLAGSADHRGEP